jgi:fatty acid synthase, animal type
MEKFLSSSGKESVVISGIAGRFPRSRNVAEFADNLFKKIDMTDDDESRWNHSNPLLGRKTGRVPDIEKFDPQFFKVKSPIAKTCDPQGRMILEHAVEAVLDAGVDLKSLENSNAGVFIANVACDFERCLMNRESKATTRFAGTMRALLANRISFALGLRGPSLSVDTACSSSITAFDLAYKSILSGECDSAIVGAAHLNLDESIVSEFYQ